MSPCPGTPPADTVKTSRNTPPWLTDVRGSPYWVLLQHRAGDAFATDVVATGRSWTAAEAVQRGVVTGLVPGRELLPAAVELASRLAARPAAALAALIETRRTRLRWAELEAWTTRGRGLGWSADRSVS